MSQEELRSRLAARAARHEEDSGHLSFEQLRDAESADSSIDDAALIHLAQCEYCSELMRTVNPLPDDIAQWAHDAARGRPGSPKTAVAQQGSMWPSATVAKSGESNRISSIKTVYALPLAASIAAIAFTIGLTTAGMPGSHDSEGLSQVTVPTAQNSNGRDGDALNREIDEGQVRCVRETENPELCVRFADAARLQALGSKEGALFLLSDGFERAGVEEEIADSVLKTLAMPGPMQAGSDQGKRLPTYVTGERSATMTNAIVEAAQLQWRAGEHEKALASLSKYMTEAGVDAGTRTAFVEAYASPVGAVDEPAGKVSPSNEGDLK
jgi:cytochrome c5